MSRSKSAEDWARAAAVRSHIAEVDGPRRTPPGVERTVLFTVSQQFTKQNLDPNQFMGMTLEAVSGDLAGTITSYYTRVVDGEQRFSS